MEPRQPPASVVVVTRNRTARLKRVLRSLTEQTLPASDFEVVVVDDGSTDGTRDLVFAMARELAYELRVVRVNDRPGLGAVRNRGWRETQGSLVCFVDDDCEADPRWLAALLEASDSPETAVQGRTTAIERELHQNGPLSRTKLIEAAGPWYQTCNIGYPRSLLERLDGFDESFRVAGEDTDLGWRAIEAGARIVYAPEAHVRHAVEEIGVRGWLRIAARERVLARLFARHPALRAHVVRLGLFKGDDRAAFALALAGAALGRRFAPALALAGPYAVQVARRCRATRAHPGWIPWFVAYDAIAFGLALRGAVENRVPLI